jgi:hypothetical protein
VTIDASCPHLNSNPSCPLRPDTSEGAAPEVPRYESTRGPGTTADVDYWTSREAVEALRSHVNYVVPDTKRWEQSAAYYIEQASGSSLVREERRPGLRNSIPAQRLDARLHARLHRPIDKFAERASMWYIETQKGLAGVGRQQMR